MLEFFVGINGQHKSYYKQGVFLAHNTQHHMLEMSVQPNMYIISRTVR